MDLKNQETWDKSPVLARLKDQQAKLDQDLNEDSHCIRNGSRALVRCLLSEGGCLLPAFGSGGWQKPCVTCGFRSPKSHCSLCKQVIASTRGCAGPYSYRRSVKCVV